jgi:hypothetical protein
MSEKKIRAFEEIGYIKKLPKRSDINDYESIKIKIKNGDKITLYRNLSKKKEIDDTSDFGSSWDVFNSLH